MRTTVVPVHHAPLNLVKSFLLIGERVVIVDAGMRGGATRSTHSNVLVGVRLT
jgi:hypothetical protein